MGKDSMMLHPPGSEEPMCVQALLQLWSPPCYRLRAQRSFEQVRLFFRKLLGVHGLYIGTSAKDRSVRGQLRSKASYLLANPPRNEPGVTGRPRWALRICWEVQSPLRICWELVGFSSQVLYNH